MDGSADQLVLVLARHIISMSCDDWRFRSSGVLSLIAVDPRPLMLLYQILRVCGSFWEMASPKWACLGEREKGLGDLRLRVLAGGWVWGVGGGGSGCVGGLVCCGVWMDCREEVGGAVPPSDVIYSRSKYVYKNTICTVTVGNKWSSILNVVRKQRLLDHLL